MVRTSDRHQSIGLKILVNGKHIFRMDNSFILVVVICIDQSLGSVPSILWKLNTDFSNRTYADPSFNITDSRGRLHCVAACSSRRCCRTITYNSITSVCTGYSSLFSDSNSFTSDAGSESYHLENTEGTAFHSYDNDTDLCFALKINAQTHSAAALRCQQENGSLIRIDTAARLTVVQNALKAYYNGINTRPDIWIDGIDYTNNNNYVMTNGEVIPLTDDLWIPDEPNSPAESCVGLYLDFKLNDFTCENEFIYLCEY